MATTEERVEQLKKRKRRPMSPGEVAAGIIEEQGITQTELAARIGVSRVQLNRVLNGHAALTPDMAHRFGRFFGNGPALWLNLQRTRDLWDVLHMDASAYEKIAPLETAA